MAESVRRLHDVTLELGWNELTGAVGDSVTVLPIVVAVAALTELSLGAMLLWFGVFQVVWGLYYGVPLSVEPMKALAALLLAGTLTTGEFLVAGLLAGGVLLAAGATGTLGRVADHVGEPVVRGVQFAVALVLLETGAGLSLGNPPLAAGAAALALAVVVAGDRPVAALVVLFAGGVVAAVGAGVPAASLPAVDVSPQLSAAALTRGAAEASVAQLGMTVGNAAVATSLLVGELYDRELSPDELSASMGAMTLLSVPAGGLPMCHGSGGVAGKHAFGARTATANVVLGVGYVAAAVAGAGLVMAFPMATLGVILALVAVELARAAFRTDRYAFVVGVGVLGILVGVGVAFLVGAGLSLALERRRDER